MGNKVKTARCQTTAKRPTFRSEDVRPHSFPNMHALLRIAVALPVTTAEDERANSNLKYI